MAATAPKKNPKTITVYGRLSFPTWSAQEAYDRSQKGKYPAKTVADAKPEFSVVLDQAQFDKIMGHIEKEFLPYCVQQHADGEKKDVLEKSEADTLLAGLKGDLSKQTFNTPFKAVSEKTLELAPGSVAVLKAIGNAGVDLEQKAVVQSEDEMLIPDPDILSYPVIKPISKTVHSLYAGAYVGVTVNLYAYHNGKHPGFSAGASVAVFKADADRFGGGMAVDEDEMFLD
jgi:hypothetical protein